MVYIYTDEFVINSVDPDDHFDEEVKAIAEADLLGVIAEPFREKFVTASVYIELCTLQLEAEGMQEKLTAYEKTYKKYLTLAQTSSPTDVSNIPIGRG